MPPYNRDNNRELVEELKGQSLKELAARCDALMAQLMPDDVFNDLLKTMYVLGSRRDRARCANCGGPPHPWEAKTICGRCKKEKDVEASVRKRKRRAS